MPTKYSNYKFEEKIINKITKFADDEGYELYIVGGYVRDLIIGRARKDFDFTVVGDSLEFAHKLAKKFNSHAIVYERFRTAIIPLDGNQIEIVGTRKESYHSNSRNPVVTEGTLEDDLSRRDFTVNALAIGLTGANKGSLIDLFGGVNDIEKKLLKTPLEPEVTFSDDPLRMMRAARFASQLEFELDSTSFQVIKELKDRIKIISQERISSEFLKIIDSTTPSIGLKILYSTGLLEIIFPDLNRLAGVDIISDGDKSYGHKDVFYHSLKVLDNAAKMTNNTWLRFAALVHDIAKPITKKYAPNVGWTFHGHEELGARRMKKIFRDMKFPLEPLPYVEKLVRLHQRPMVLVDDEVTDSAIRRLAVQAGDALKDLFTLVRADITTKNPNLSVKYLENYDIVAQKVVEVQERDKLREFQSPVRGEEIMEICNIPPSRVVGIIKERIEEAILEGVIPNEYLPAKEYFMKNYTNWLNEIKNQGIIF